MYSNRLNNIVIWKKPDNTYYYRVVHHYFLRYGVGYHNSYNHEVVFIINDLDFSLPHKRFSKAIIKRKIIDCISKL